MRARRETGEAGFFLGTTGRLGSRLGSLERYSGISALRLLLLLESLGGVSLKFCISKFAIRLGTGVLPIVVESDYEISPLVEYSVFHQKGASSWKEELVLILKSISEVVLGGSEVVGSEVTLELVIDLFCYVSGDRTPINGPVEPRCLTCTRRCACIRPFRVRNS